MARAEPNMIRESVDFNAPIEERYREIHGRLENWACSLRGGLGGGNESPMFRLFRSNDSFEAGRIVSMVVDTHDAHKIDKGVRALPEQQRVAIQWFYVRTISIPKIRKMLGCTKQGLDDLVKSGRAMLVNRRV
jgi:hypothetical protein